MMKDMTQGPVSKHILGMASFIAASTLFQTLYLLVDLYFVGRLGKEAIAGVAMLRLWGIRRRAAATPAETIKSLRSRVRQPSRSPG